VAGVPSLRMNDGREIPQLGFGVFQIPPEETVEPVRLALEAGYRLIDTAQGYGNEEGVGKAIADSDVARSEIFVTTKLTNSEHGRDKALAAFDDSLNKLGLDFVDLFLIHWPQPMFDDYVETWKALEEIRASGRARSIGVSNFTEHHLNRLFNETDVIPAVNQVELHPEFPQAALRAFHADHQILTEAWSPIGQGKGLLDNPEVVSLAKAKGVSPAQVVLRWHVQLGNVVIPKSVTPQRIRDNIDVFSFELTEPEMGQISGLETGERLGPDPETFDRR
jgi:2,5-diketo-D-gluconate reductase A